MDKRNATNIETIANLCGIRAIQRLKGSLCKIALLGSYRIYLAKNSDCWNPGGLIEVGVQGAGRGVRQPAANRASWSNHPNHLKTFWSFSTFLPFPTLNVFLMFNLYLMQFVDFSSNSLFVWQLVSVGVPRRDETIKRNPPTVRARGQFNQELALLGINTPIGSAFNPDMYLYLLCIQK